MRSKILILIVMVALFSVGCQKAADKAAEKVIEKQTGGKVKINSNDGTMELDTKEGKVQFGKDDLPEDFPDDVPIYSKAKITSSVKSEETYSLTLEVSGKKSKEISKFYQKELKEGGWTSVLSADSGNAGGFIALQYKKDNREVMITINDDGEEGTVIAIQTSENK